MFIDFENIEEKCREIVNSDDYQTLVDKVRKTSSTSHSILTRSHLHLSMIQVLCL